MADLSRPTVCRVAQRLTRSRKRILDDLELFFKTQRQAQEKTLAGTGAELLRDLEMVMAIVNTAVATRVPKGAARPSPSGIARGCQRLPYGKSFTIPGKLLGI